ncbi:Hypothetical_protein [Hexamita inflata]|uniref:Hypothetical_protein n=2 Tax=Hexamita inflata TaxID=28002 RepID=A0AA86QHE5_9EUKA|nr:Hypothetical protein HINF_LOCUS45958 [Hexamita inflata]
METTEFKNQMNSIVDGQILLKNHMSSQIQSIVRCETEFQELFLEVEEANLLLDLVTKLNIARSEIQLLLLDEDIVKKCIEKSVNIMLDASNIFQKEIALVYNSLQKEGTTQSLAESERVKTKIQAEEEFQKQIRLIRDLDVLEKIWAEFQQESKYDKN